MAEDLPTLDLREQLSRIDLAREEAMKFMAEQHKLTEEAAKFKIERTLYPAIVLGTVIASAATILAHWLR